MIELLQGMVKINTVNPPGQERKLAELIRDFVSAYGLECQLHPIDENRSNVVVILRGKDPTLKKLYFNGHLDTVPIGEQPWMVDPFSAEILNGRIYGRGTTDMKGGVAALLETMITLKETQHPLEQDVVFIGTVGEEVDCLGSISAIEKGLIENPGAIVIAEPSSLDLYVAHKGALWVEIRTYGKTAHGSMPKKGVNAIDSMMSILNEIPKLQLDDVDHVLGKMSYSINVVNGGVATNVVPDYCTLNIDFRTVTASQNDKILQEIKAIIRKQSDIIEGFKADYVVLQNLVPLNNDNDSEFINKIQPMIPQISKKGIQNNSANYYTDGSVFRKYFDIPVLIYGAGEPTLAHQPDESISIKDLEKSIEFYLQLVETYQKLNKTKNKELYYNERIQ